MAQLDRHKPFAAVVLVLAWLAGLAACQNTLAQPKFPPLTGRIVDEAQLLSPADEQELTKTLTDLEAKSTDQLVIYTTNSLQGYEIEDFGYQLGRAWQIGQKDKNNGALLIVAPKDRKVRIEVGRGLEPQLTDIMTKLIIQNAILPAFRRGDFAAGIKAGVRDIRDVMLGDAEAVKDRARRTVKRNPQTNETLIGFAFFAASRRGGARCATAGAAVEATTSSSFRAAGAADREAVPAADRTAASRAAAVISAAADRRGAGSYARAK
jgi:uncharacterized protein